MPAKYVISILWPTAFYDRIFEQESIPVGCVPAAQIDRMPGEGCFLPSQGSFLSGVGGAWLPGVASFPGGGVSQHGLRQTPPVITESHTQVEIITLAHNFIAAGTL